MTLLAPAPVAARATTDEPSWSRLRQPVGITEEAEASRRRSVVFVLAWTVAWAFVSRVGGMYSWHYFATGGRLLTMPGSPQGGVHLFASHPELQMGPVTLAVSALVVKAVGTTASSWLAGALMLGLGGLDVWLLTLLAPGRRFQRWLVSALVVIPAWSVLAVHYGHLDDVLALSFMAAALVAARRGHPWAAVVAAGLAAAAKPWALPMILLGWGGREHRVRRLLLGGVLSVLPWVPFVLGDPRTLAIGSFGIQNAADSALRVWGVTDATTPWWCRATQLGLGVTLAWLAARSGRIEWIPLVVVTSRLLLDPGTYLYYTSGLVLAALAVDLGSAGRRPWPRLALVVSGWLVLDLFLKWRHLPFVAGPVRAAFLVSLLALFGWTLLQPLLAPARRA
ncbi:MAG TPA: hypothetical protein VHO26_09505 [Propionibacteriaceae bacterium]|nr:hypothetical protein [Propionibacteriaceae bacterium]